MKLILIGTFASLLAGSATLIGALAVFLINKVSDKFLDTCMGFSAGVMLSVTFFGLIAPAIHIGGVWKTVFGILIGTLFLIFAEKLIPHLHWVAGVKGPKTRLNKLTLLILAITIHNFPEGLSVGVGFSQGALKAGIILAVGIGLQNIIEGFIVALPVYRTEKKALHAFMIASFTAIVEPIGGFLGISIVSLSKGLIPYGLAFAAGAMLFVISEEVMPETHSRGNVREATIGLILGFTLMLILENVFV
jgi:zinc transporter, ZIP family